MKTVSPKLQPDLESLLWPLSKREFLENYWERSHYYTAGMPDRLDTLLSSFGGFEPADLLRWRTGDVVATFKATGMGQESVIVSSDEEARLRYDNGESLLFNLNTQDARLKTWFDAFTGPLTPTINRSGVTAVCSPPGHGTSMHFDPHDVFNITLRGSKTWRVAPNREVMNPLHGWQVGRSSVPELSSYWPNAPEHGPSELMTLEMSAGSVAYIPRGYYHETETFDEPSVGISFVLDVVSFHELISNALRTLILRDADLRKSANKLWCTQTSDDNRKELADRLVSFKQLAESLRPEDISPPPREADLSGPTRLCKSVLAHRSIEKVNDRSKVLVRRVDQSDAAQIEMSDCVILDWIDEQPESFTLDQACLVFVGKYGRSSLLQMFTILVETGYLSILENSF